MMTPFGWVGDRVTKAGMVVALFRQKQKGLWGECFFV